MTLPCQISKTTTWKDAVEKLRSIPGYWCFRGQADSRWELATSLHRVCSASGWNGAGGSSLELVERKMITKWKRNAPRYLQASLPTTELEWLALMQHHGTPTRLLDWTMSPYIAAYFALENAAETCAIWAMDLNWCLHHALKNLHRDQKSTPPDSPFWSSTEYANLLGSAPAGVYPVTPFQLNERIRIQHGFFLYPTDSTRTFVQNLMALGPDELKDRVIKIEIPRAVRSDGLADLHRMTVNKETLFPGLDGFAQGVTYEVLKS